MNRIHNSSKLLEDNIEEYQITRNKTRCITHLGDYLVPKLTCGQIQHWKTRISSNISV